MLVDVLITIFSIGVGVYVLIFLYFILASTPMFNRAKIINKKISNQYYFKKDVVIFVSDGNFFSLGGKGIKGADKASFAVLADNMAKDKKAVYYHDKVIESADPPTLEIIHAEQYDKGRSYVRYCRDINHAFYLNRIITKANPESFNYLWGQFTQDNESLFYEENRLCDFSKAPEPIPNDAKGNYCRVGDAVYFRDKIIQHADSGSLTAMELYSKDNHNVYCQEKRVPNTDSASFEVLNIDYQRDKKHLYYQSRIMPGADPKTYEFLSILYSKDNKQVYYCGQIMIGVDAQNFNLKKGEKLYDNRQLINLILDDNHCLYALRSECINFDSDKTNNVERLSRYFHYKGDVYCGCVRIMGAKPENFRVLPFSDQSYTTDDEHVFYHSYEINNADVTTFNAINGNFAIDINAVYAGQNRLSDQRPEHFEYQEGMWGKELEDGSFILVQN